VNVDLLDAAGAGATWESAPGQTLRLRSQPVPLTAGRSDPLTSLEGRYTVRVSNGNTELVYREIELFAGQTTRVEP
jgi:hypothetical protein